MPYLEGDCCKEPIHDIDTSVDAVVESILI